MVPLPALTCTGSRRPCKRPAGSAALALPRTASRSLKPGPIILALLAAPAGIRTPVTPGGRTFTLRVPRALCRFAKTGPFALGRAGAGIARGKSSPCRSAALESTRSFIARVGRPFGSRLSPVFPLLAFPRLAATAAVPVTAGRRLALAKTHRVSSSAGFLTTLLGGFRFRHPPFALGREAKLGQLARLQLAELAWLNIENQGTIANPTNLFHVVADFLKHLSQFAITTLSENHFVPRVIAGLGLPDGCR